MTTVADMITRVHDVLQDPDGQSWSSDRAKTQMQDEMTRLSRRGLWGEITWLQGVANQSLYTLPSDTVEISHVLYNERMLRFATEDMLDRKSAAWEFQERDPVYWTSDNQTPNVLRLVPAPLISGSAVPVFPPYPMINNPEDNLIVFHSIDMRSRVDDEVDTFPIHAMWEDVMTYLAAYHLAQEEGAYQNLPVSTTMREMGTLWLKQLGVAS